MDKDEIHSLTHSYRNYHGQVNKLWNGFEKPCLIPETGWDHTFYEMQMPITRHSITMPYGSALLPEFHAPFWWAYSNSLNDNVVTNQMLSLRRFTDHIPFNKLTNLGIVEAKSSEGDVYAVGSDQLIFGWAVNPVTDMAGKKITLKILKKVNIISNFITPGVVDSL